MDLPVANIPAISYYQNYSHAIQSDIQQRYYPSLEPSLKREIDLPPPWVHPLDISPKGTTSELHLRHGSYV